MKTHNDSDTQSIHRCFLTLSYIYLAIGLLFTQACGDWHETTVAEKKAAISMDSTLTDQWGDTHRLSDFAKQWLVINYWASWCAPCREEIPELNALQRENKHIRVIGINFDHIPMPQLKRESNKLGIQFPVLIDDPSHFLNIAQANALPYTVVFSPGLKRVHTLLGPQTKHAILQLIQQHQ